MVSRSVAVDGGRIRGESLSTGYNTIYNASDQFELIDPKVLAVL
jgi:hypothetical protein